eukprot:IDg6974t1
MEVSTEEVVKGLQKMKRKSLKYDREFTKPPLITTPSFKHRKVVSGSTAAFK